MKGKRFAAPRREERDRRIDSILMSQHGVISKWQAHHAGASHRRVLYLLESGRWQRLYRSVYKSATHPSSAEQQVLAACLAAGKGEVAAACGRTAGRLHKLDGAVRGGTDSRWNGAGAPDGLRPIEVLATRRARLPDVVVFREACLDEADLCLVDGVLITTVARTIVDIARGHPRWLAERALDDALRRGLTSLDEVEDAAGRAARSGRRSLKGLRRIIATRHPEDALTESRLEQRVMRALRHGGLPRPVAQQPVRAGGRTLRLDLAFPEARLGIEVDGFEFHNGRRAFDVDRRRANDLLLAGWTILRVTSEMKDGEIVEVVGRALRERSALDAPRATDRAVGGTPERPRWR